MSAKAKVKEKMRPAAELMARVGSVSVGTVYVLIGVWAMLALLGVARPAADEERILQRLLDMPLGRALIAAIAVGTVGYVVWLLFEAIFDPYDFGNTLKGLVERIGIAASALAYVVIVSAAVKVLRGRGGDGEDEQQFIVDRALAWPGGRWLVAAAGLVLVVAGLYQIKYVYDGEHRRRLALEGRGPFACRLLDALAWAGYLARCAILVVLGGFFLKAAWTFDPEAVGDTDAAFDFLGLGGGLLGNTIFSLVALGTVGYGLFLYASAIYFRADNGEPITRASRRTRRSRRGPAR